MATYNVTAQTRRVQYTGDGTAGNFAFSFQINATSELKVYVDSTEKTETTHYTVTLNSGTGAGTVAFTSGNFPTSSQTVTLLSDIPLSRTSIYTSGGQLTSSSLEDDFDTNMFIHQQTNEEIDRSLRLAEHDVISGADMTLPVKATRAGKILGFNETTGNPEASILTADAQTLADIASDIATLADIEDGTDATDAIQTVAGISTSVSNVSSISSTVSSVNSNSTNINTVSSNITNVGKVATIDANVTKVANIDSDVTAVANIDSNVTVVAGKASLITSDFASGMSLVTSDFVSDVNALAVTDVINDINLLATSDIVSDLNTLADSDIVSDLNTLATSDIVSDLNTLATTDIVSDINTLATSDVVSDLNLLATSDFVADLNTLATATNVANLATVASNITGVNSFNDRYRVGSSLPADSLDQGDLFFNTTENELRAYNGTTWQATAPSSSDQVNINIVAGEITSSEDLGSITESIDTSSGNNIDTVANDISNINTVAGISSNVTSVAGVSSNVTTVAGISSDVSTVAGISSDVSTVASDGTDIGTVAGISSNVTTVAGISSDVTTVSGISANVTTVAGDSTDISTVATNISNVNTVAGNNSNITTVAGNNANITTVAGVSSDVTSVAGISSNVTAVANNVSSINNFEARYRVSSSEPTTSLDEGDLYYNTTTNALNYYNGSSFVPVVAGAMTSLLSDTTPQLGGNLDINGNSIVSTSNGNIAITPNGTGSVVIDGLSHPQSDGSAGQFLKTDGSGQLAFATVNTDLSNDTTPQLGGNLDVNGNSIVSVSNGDITIAPNGSGEINLNGTVNTDNLTMDFGSIA